jgi:hypothetical protein
VNATLPGSERHSARKNQGDRIESNLSKTKNIPPKAVIFSDFCCTFAMPLMIFACLDLQH